MKITPKGHKDGEKDGALVIKQICNLRVKASFVKYPILAEEITGWTHVESGTVATVANFLTRMRERHIIT